MTAIQIEIILVGCWLLRCGTYTCSIRKRAKIKPYHYNGYDPDVLKYMAMNIQLKMPAIITRRSAIS